MHDISGSSLFALPPGSGCSKLATSLVNISLNFQKTLVNFSNMSIFFVEKMEEAFAVQKLLSFFQQKISVYLVIKSYNT